MVTKARVGADRAYEDVEWYARGDRSARVVRQNTTYWGPTVLTVLAAIHPRPEYWSNIVKIGAQLYRLFFCLNKAVITPEFHLRIIDLVKIAP